MYIRTKRKKASFTRIAMRHQEFGRNVSPPQEQTVKIGKDASHYRTAHNKENRIQMFSPLLNCYRDAETGMHFW